MTFLMLWGMAGAGTADAVDAVSSAEPGGPTPQVLAQNIVDEASSYQLVPGSAAIAINAPGNPDSNPRAMGTFSSGLTPAGTFLPAENQPDPLNPTATYAGGLGIDSGVCLCTGLTSDNDPFVDPQSIPTGLGVGVQGPNNGHPLADVGVVGELDFELGAPADNDYVAEVTSGLDATVLTFDIELQSPGILQITYVHGTDEHPNYSLGEYNDTFLVFIRNPRCPNPAWSNFILFRELNELTVLVEENTLTLANLQGCGYFLENLVAPAPQDLASSSHGNVETTDHFDHEFAGFSVPLTFEATSPLDTSPLYRNALAPGVYNIKMVIQDVADDNLDSAAFILEDSLKLFPLQQGDFDGDGCVDIDDFRVWRDNFGKSPATFYDGDGNGNCNVDLADYTVWRDHLGASGNGDCEADFNRDGVVNGTDYFIWLSNVPQAKCASRFQGDADGDGDVDELDFDIWQAQFGNCGGCAQSASSGPADELNTLLPVTPDANDDGELSKTELEEMDTIIKEWESAKFEVDEVSEPKLAPIPSAE